MSNFKLRFKILGLSLIVALVLPPVVASAVVSWEFKDDTVNLGLTGVSPHVEKTGSSDRVWYPGGLSGTTVSDCSDVGTCNLVAGTGRLGSDFTAITLPNGSRRAYFVEMLPNGGQKQVASAACATSECLSVGTSTLTNSNLLVSQDEKAWGVPDPVVTPDGKVRLFVVETPGGGACNEKVASYISDDGITFTKESGWRFEGGYVDTEVLRAKTGDWLMITSNGPGCAGMIQRLFVASSNDGLSWSTPTAVTKTDKSRLDPTGYEVSPNVFRIYFATSAGGMDHDFRLARGTLKIGQPIGEIAATTSKVGTKCNKSGAKTTEGKTKLTCKKVKGKLIWSK